jgi:predicted dehydrogenase
MTQRHNRRDFIKTATVAGFGFWIAGKAAADSSRSPLDKIRFACIGIEGKGQSDSADAAHHGDIVAICDVDETRLGKAGEKYPQAKKFTDFRQMLDEMSKSIDAVTVSTPDHTHATAAASAMHLGKHCFCQKPLTHAIFEARWLGMLARAKKVATQMGNQGTANDGLRRGAAIVQAGALGNVKEVHVWTNRPIWPQGGPRPAPSAQPETLNWDAWLGPARYRPYASGYHPFAWRGFWDFGTGALGDMACHTVNLPFAALDLRDPISVEAESAENNKETYPTWAVIKFQFPARGKRGPLTMIWYEGGKNPGARKPPEELFDGQKISGSGSLIIGEKGKLYSPDDYGGSYKLLGGVTEPTVDVAKSPGHFTEWVNAIKGGPPAMSNFPDYASPLTETILLGNLAVWAGKKVEWDPQALKAKNAPEVEHIVRPVYRRGWTL